MYKTYGPYTRKDGRMILVIIEGDTRTTLSYPKHLMQEHLGRKLEADETVDHIDNNPLNNNLDNLQILSRAENARKAIRPAEVVELVCKQCGSTFTRRLAVENYNRNIREKDGPFCSKQCVGKRHH